MSSASESGEVDTTDFRRTAKIELALDSGRRQLVIDGLGDVGTIQHFELVAVLAEQYRADLRAELKSENHAFVPVEKLTDRLGVESEETLRKRISDFRKRVGDLALKKWGLPLTRNTVIENKTRTGYRLNPAVAIVDPKEIGPEVLG